MHPNDEELFKLWRDKKMYVEDVLRKAKDPEELARRIIEAKRKLAEAKRKLAEGGNGKGHGE